MVSEEEEKKKNVRIDVNSISICYPLLWHSFFIVRWLVPISLWPTTLFVVIWHIFLIKNTFRLLMDKKCKTITKRRWWDRTVLLSIKTGEWMNVLYKFDYLFNVSKWQASCLWQLEQLNLHVIATNTLTTRSAFNRNKRFYSEHLALRYLCICHESIKPFFDTRGYMKTCMMTQNVKHVQ